jgi:hypothetical protein
MSSPRSRSISSLTWSMNDGSRTSWPGGGDDPDGSFTWNGSSSRTARSAGESGVGEDGGGDDGVGEGHVGEDGAVEGDDGDVGVPLASECTEGIHTDPPSDRLDPSWLASSGMGSRSIPSLP